jgi:site-specific DNA-methyltransferase (adenine-specific)
VRAWIPRKEATTNKEAIDRWKVLVPSAYGERGAIPAQVLGPTEVVGPPSICTQSFLFVLVDDEAAGRSLASYVQTRFLRFLVSLRKISQHTTSDTYSWVPQQTWDRTWTDAELYNKYRITADEQAYIESLIKEMAP